MKLFQTIVNISVVVLACIACVICGVYLYFHYFVKDFTIGTNNIGNQVEIVKPEDLTQTQIDEYENRWFMEANYYSNEKNNGIELQELNFNYFETYRLEEIDYRATGMQYLGDYVHKNVTVWSDSERDNYVFKDFCYYDTVNHISYSGYYGNKDSTSTLLKRSTTFVVQIDGKPYALKLDKSYFSGWWIFGSTHYYTYSELFQSVFNSIKSSSGGYGDYYIKLDLSDYFSIYEFDPQTGKYKPDDVTDIIKNYAVLKYHYDENGARASNQSLFKSINCNPNYGVEEIENLDYWQERFVYNLSAKDMDYRFNQDGYLASLKLDTKTYLANTERKEISISLNLQDSYLQNQNINLIGLDFEAFNGLPIKRLEILGTGDFVVPETALNNTGITTIYKSSGISLCCPDGFIVENIYPTILLNAEVG